MEEERPQGTGSWIEEGGKPRPASGQRQTGGQG
ncbi:hypothetical protein CRUP_033221 [Coryphaenoides rupestris]|nr:hypothetical protein CRUP_033221 [Coryphaenoides rupestris]